MEVAFLPTCLLRGVPLDRRYDANVVCSIALLALALPLLRAVPHLCLAQRLLHHPCPGCGVTTGLLALRTLHPAIAWRANPASLAITGSVLAQLLGRGISLCRSNGLGRGISVCRSNGPGRGITLCRSNGPGRGYPLSGRDVSVSNRDGTGRGHAIALATPALTTTAALPRKSIPHRLLRVLSGAAYLSLITVWIWRLLQGGLAS